MSSSSLRKKSSFKCESTNKSGSDSELILILGGTFDEETPKIEIYYPHSNKWFGYKNNPQSLEYINSYGATLMEENLIIAGGEENADLFAVKKVHSLNLRTMKWTVMQNMQTPRSCFGIAVLSTSLYAVGGWDGCCETLSSVERWNAESNEWTYVSSLNTKRQNHGVVVLNDKIFVLGGSSDPLNEDGSLSSIECYDSALNSWTTKSSMSTKRQFPAVGVYKDCIYVFGGYDKDQRLNSAERYNPSKDEWTKIASMSVPRTAFGCALINNNFLLVGGKGRHPGGTQIVAKYNPETNEYSQMPQLLYPRFFFHAITIPNVIPEEVLNK